MTIVKAFSLSEDSVYKLTKYVAKRNGNKKPKEKKYSESGVVDNLISKLKI